MVSVMSSRMVIPSEPTPTGIFPLSDFDQSKPSIHIPLLFVYRPLVNDQPFLPFSIHILTKSLSQSLVHFYPLAGHLRENLGGRFQLHCSGRGAQLLEAVSLAKLDEFGDFKPSQDVEQLVPEIDYNLPVEEIPLLAVQLTKFRCGGLSLGVSLSRAVVDGACIVHFVNSWARITRGEGLDLSSTEMLHRDSSILDSRVESCAAPRFDHPEFSPPPLWLGSLVDAEDEAAAAILKLTKNQVQQLKEKASNFDAPRRPYTSFEVISGVLWRCACKARYGGNGDQPTRLSARVNCRNRLRPPLHNSYFGNAAIPTVTKTSTFDDVISKPVSYAVGEIRRALEKVTDDYARSALDYIAGQKDARLLRNTCPGKSKGNPNLDIVSWMNFPFQDADFGWGKPVYMGPGNIHREGKAFLMSNGDGDGFMVALCLQVSHMVAFKKLFYEETGDMFRTTSKL
ncbi:spermidine hydroxycinnamoyl transferase-like [Prosopis cineraria]|uniref:spermidine hydroxycinnamoyl transferase-like n=1 Tax=Prosopis cineraria TaxID=364024 RepID=UPI00240EE4C8|nr:spermidine hydroxycinnamoyl transferase-like [Prosopis cineraria]